MSDDHAATIDRDVKIYVGIFLSLMVLTALTVGAWKFLDLPLGLTITVALFIASIKATLVACFFMHLISERKLIYSVLILTVVFFIALMVLPLSSFLDHLSSWG